MSQNVNQLPLALFSLRLGVFIVFLVWSFDKFLNPEHASKVFQTFYMTPGFGPVVSYIIGAAQLLLTLGFVLGVKKRVTYGAIFLLHAVSTLSSYKQYTTEFHLLFFAAWPMLAACFALYLLRDHDTLWTLSKPKG